MRQATYRAAGRGPFGQTLEPEGRQGFESYECVESSAGEVWNVEAQRAKGAKDLGVAQTHACTLTLGASKLPRVKVSVKPPRTRSLPS